MTEPIRKARRGMALSAGLSVLSLCSGVGGLDLGVRLARPDARVICYVERNPFAVSVLRARIADGWLCDAPIWDDLTTFDGQPWRGVVDCVIAGAPCQPFSQAARGRHVARDLLADVLRVVDECRPSVVFLENVYNARKRFSEVRLSLHRLGYCSPPLLDCRASDVAAPHIRRRLFLFAHADGYRQPDLPVDDEVAELAPAGASVWEDHAEPLRMAHGLADRLDMPRKEAAGNGVVPLVAAHAWRTLSSRRYAVN